MKNLRYLVTIPLVVLGFLVLVSCQGINLNFQPVKNKVSIAFSGYSKQLVGGSSTSRSLTSAPVQQISKQAFLASRNTGSSSRLIHPDTYYYEVIVTAPDMETIDAIFYSTNNIIDLLDFYVPAGYARSFTIVLWDSTGTTKLGSTQVISDVVISPTLIDAVVVPDNAIITNNVTILNSSGGNAISVYLTDQKWNLVRFNFEIGFTNVQSLNIYADSVDPNSYFVVIPFDVSGAEISSSDYSETPATAQNAYSISIAPQTSYDSNGNPINNTDIYLLIRSPIQTAYFYEGTTIPSQSPPP